jgi:hypothetical protein
LRTHLLISINPTVGSNLPFPFSPFVYIVLVASTVVLYSVIRKHQKQLSSAPRLALPSLDPIGQLLGPPCILFDEWFNTKTQTQTDRRTDRLAQTNTDGQTDNSLCCVLCQRPVPLGALGELTFATDSQCLCKEARLYPFRSYAHMESRLISPFSLLPLLLFHLSPSSAACTPQDHLSTQAIKGNRLSPPTTLTIDRSFRARNCWWFHRSPGRSQGGFTFTSNCTSRSLCQHRPLDAG